MTLRAVQEITTEDIEQAITSAPSTAKPFLNAEFRGDLLLGDQLLP